MKTYTFNPKFDVIKSVKFQDNTGKWNPFVSIKEMEKEQGVYSATPEFVRKHCGKIANTILNAIPLWYYEEATKHGLYPNIDVRVHRLYPGDYPAYPGWHCDGEFRETYFSQPDLDRIKVHKHIICTVSTSSDGVSNCQFLAEPFSATVEAPEPGHTLWGQVHSQLEQTNEKRLVDTKDGDMVLFDSWSLHRVMPAKIRGWRLFFRMAMWHKPNLGDGGMLTKQEQVYKVVEGSGW